MRSKKACAGAISSATDLRVQKEAKRPIPDSVRGAGVFALWQLWDVDPESRIPILTMIVLIMEHRRRTAARSRRSNGCS